MDFDKLLATFCNSEDGSKAIGPTCTGRSIDCIAGQHECRRWTRSVGESQIIEAVKGGGSHLLVVIANTVPPSAAPPSAVVPYNVLPSDTNPASGLLPSLFVPGKEVSALKLYRLVKVAADVLATTRNNATTSRNV